MTTSETRRAMTAPESLVTPISMTLMNDAIAASRETPRGRMILPLHKSHADTLHRMFNAMQPGTYIRPHRHLNPAKDESIVILNGALCVVIFDDHGRVTWMFDAKAGSEVFGVDITAGVFHTFVVLESDTVMFEVKPGPYSALDDKDFATWAPREEDPGAAEYLTQLMRIRSARDV